MTSILALVPVTPDQPPAAIAPALEKAADLARQEKAQATRRAYRSDLEMFRLGATVTAWTRYRPALGQWRAFWAPRWISASVHPRLAAGLRRSVMPTSWRAPPSPPMTSGSRQPC